METMRKKRKSQCRKYSFIKPFIQLNMCSAPYRILHHIYVYGLCRLPTLVSTCRKCCITFLKHFKRFRIIRSVVEHGAANRLKRPIIHWSSKVVHRVCLLGDFYAWYFSYDGRPFGIFAYVTSALVKL